MARLRFGRFQFDSETGELLRDGNAVRLQAQPAKVLALLVSAGGELVTREALREAIWNDGTTVDFDRGLNFAIAQVRTALGDSADSPTFIRTVPKRGYQFIAPIASSELAPQSTLLERSRRGVLSWLAVAGAGSAVGLGVVAFRGSRRTAANEPPIIAVARFQNESGNPALDRLADAVTDSLVAELTMRTAGSFGVIGNAPILRQPRSFQDVDAIASTLQARYVILGQVQRDGLGFRSLAHLIRLPGKTHVKVSRTEVDEAASASQIAKQIVDDFASKLDSPPAASR